MSIALSVLVHPSRTLRRALVACGAAQAALGSAILAGWAGPLAQPGLLGAAALACAALAWARAASAPTAHQIDVSGLGEIRLTVKQKLGRAPWPALPLQLLPGSTVWPQLLLLRLAAGGGKQGKSVFLPVLPDSLTQDEFRALAVAIRSIASRNKIFLGKNKIV